MRIGENSFFTVAPVAVTSTGDKLTFLPAIPVRLVRWGYIVSGVALDNTPLSLVIALDTNDILASSVRTERDRITRTAVDEALGSVVAKDLAAFKMQPELDSQVIVPGQAAIIEVITASTGGIVAPFIEYTPLSWQTLKQVGAGSAHYPKEG